MGYFYWDGIPRKADDPTRIAAFVAAGLAAQDELAELGDVNIPAPANGEVLTWDAATSKWIASAPAGDGDLSLSRYLKIGVYHWSPLISNRNVSGSTPIANNRLYALPFPIPAAMSFDRIAAYLRTSAVGAMYLGIYNDSGTYPSSLRLDAGTVNTGTAGLKAITITQTLPAGLYWLAFLANAAPSLSYSTYFEHILIGTPHYVANAGYWVAQGYGALPNPFPGGATEDGNLWNMQLRRSA